MKPALKLLLAVSLSLNVVSGFVLFSRTNSAITRLPGEHAQPPISAEFQTNIVEIPTAGKPFRWETVESEDYRRYIANLRRIGCPEETIRDIITADVDKLFVRRRREVLAADGGFQFWKTTSRGVYGRPLSDDQRTKLLALAEERRSVLKELLGTVDHDATDLFSALTLNPMALLLDFLPLEKQGRVTDLLRSHQARLMKLASGQPSTPEEAKAMNDAAIELKAELARILSPAEFEEYQLRASPTASSLRTRLDGFDPSEMEFREIFKIEEAFLDEAGRHGTGVMSIEEHERRQAAIDGKEEQLLRVLGPERYAEYKRESDYAYKTILRLAERQGMGREAAVNAWNIKQMAEEAVRQVRSDALLSASQRAEKLAAIRQETERALAAELGREGFQSYSATVPANWLKRLR